MEKLFRVGYIGVVAGDPEANDYEEMSDRVGITRFSAPAETILDIVKDTEPGPKLDCSKLRIKPEQQLLDFYGGRMMNFFSKNEVSDALKNIEVLIISSSSNSYFYMRTYLMRFAGHATLSKSCSIVLQLPSMFDSTNAYTAGEMNAKGILGFMGITENGEQISTGRFKKKQKGGHKQKIIAIGHEKYGGVEADVGIAQLESVLFQAEVTEDIIKPVKETLSAGKSFLNIGRSFGGWITNLFSSAN